MQTVLAFISYASWTSCFFCWSPMAGERLGACDRCRAEAIPAERVPDAQFRVQYLLGRRTKKGGT